MTIEGKIVDILNREIYEGSLFVEQGRIVRIKHHSTQHKHYILPGFVDAHIHIESSMLTPSIFGSIAVKHGTIAIVTDPHEIANVCGIKGIEFMIEESRNSPIKTAFTAPSCVPSTPFESSGAILSPYEVSQLLERPEFVALSEMMNYPGVLNGSDDCLQKIQAAQALAKPIDGHCPLLAGEELECYIQAGISTDHETHSLANALEKLKKGMYLQIREGSSAKNFDTLLPLLKDYPKQIMFCSDDLKAPDLLNGHINRLVARALSKGYDLFDTLRAASLNAIHHYSLPVGLLQEGDPADFIVCDNLHDFLPNQVWIDGQRADLQTPLHTSSSINHFLATPLTDKDLFYPYTNGQSLPVIGVVEGEIWTKHLRLIRGQDQAFQKIVVLNRYTSEATPAIGHIKGFNLQSAAIATTIAHDSHNLIATGSDDQLIVHALNALIEQKGGMTLCLRNQTSGTITQHILPLPIAGLMTDEDPITFSHRYLNLLNLIRQAGCPLASPFMTLSFMALPVIPHLKITDHGLFDVDHFEFISSF